MTALLLTPRILTKLCKLSVSFKVGEVTIRGVWQQFKASPPRPLLTTVLKGFQFGTNKGPEGLKCDMLAGNLEKVFFITVEGGKRNALLFWIILSPTEKINCFNMYHDSCIILVLRGKWPVNCEQLNVLI